MLGMRHRWREVILAALFAGLITAPGEALLAFPPSITFGVSSSRQAETDTFGVSADPTAESVTFGVSGSQSFETSTLGVSGNRPAETSTLGVSTYPTFESDSDQPATEVCTGEKLGTTIDWYDDPHVAARLAEEQGKLIYVIQVSGNFAREEFT